MEVMAHGLVLESFLMDPPECLALFFHSILWDFPNRQARQGNNFCTLLIFLVVIYHLEILGRDLNEKWFNYGAKLGSSSHIVQ